MTHAAGTLLLLPNLLGDHKHHELFLPASVDKAVETLDGLIAESESGGRRFLSRFKIAKPVHQVPLAIIDEHTKDDSLDFYLEPLLKGEKWGYVPDAGLPCVADPGARLVQRARELGIVIKAFVGPSSLMLALMLSGLPGQRFSFLGYLSREQDERERRLKTLERDSRANDATQIFIEAPYRNAHTLESCLSVLQDDTMLCVGWDLTLPTQGLLSQPVATWKKSPLPNLAKKPAIFLIYRAPAEEGGRSTR